MRVHVVLTGCRTEGAQGCAAGFEDSYSTELAEVLYSIASRSMLPPTQGRARKRGTLHNKGVGKGEGRDEDVNEAPGER